MGIVRARDDSCTNVGPRAAAHVDQWKCDAEARGRFVVEQLGLRRSRHRVDVSGTRPSGSLTVTRGTRCWASARTRT